MELKDLLDRSIITLLGDYSGTNPYINDLKKAYLKKGKILLTDNQRNYIKLNYSKEPLKLDKIIRITPYLGETLKETEELTFIPAKILIEYLVGETERVYHVYGKVKQNQKTSKFYWLPKTQLLDDLFFEEIDVEVDFDKYNKLDQLSRAPFKHQIQGVKFLLSRTHCILADDMGLG